MNIELHIERLVLDGSLSGHDGELVRAAVERELGRLLAAGALSPQNMPGGAVPTVQGPAIRIAKGTGPNRLGVKIAGAVRSSIGTAR